MKKLLLFLLLLFSCEDDRTADEPQELIQMWLDCAEIRVYD